jgi:uncharacterized protein (TIGR02284 family)
MVARPTRAEHWSSNMSDLIDCLQTLHTSLIDARSGYDEGLKDAHGKGLAPLFSELIATHGASADAIAEHLQRLGAKVDDAGSLMGTFDRVVMKLSSMLTELDEKIIPSLIDGEQRVLSHYDAAIDASSPGSAEYPTLIQQRETLRQIIAEMKSRQTRPA